MFINKLNVIKDSYNARKQILKDVSIQSQKKIVLIFGAPGSGKTTLLETIAGLERPSSGDVNLDGDVLLLMQEPEKQFVYPNCAQEISIDRPLEEVHNILKEVGLDADVSELSPWHLSGGEKKRLAIGRLIIQKQNFKRDFTLLLDDPFLELDVKGRKLIIEKLLQDKVCKNIFVAINSKTDLDYIVSSGIDCETFKLEEGVIVE